jgi:glycosyltransferase involved in cell wall biosynthesis
LENVESGLCRDVAHVLACSEADAAKLKELRHKTPITVIPNAIHVNTYQQDVDQPIADIPHPALVFTGKMDFRPNIDAALWLADEIFPAIRMSHPKAHLTIVGQKPHARLNSLKGREGITLTGYVPDVKPYLNAADVYVAPLRMGSGTRFKLLEAMAMGKAIVSTRLGAEGLSVENGREMWLADTTSDFAMAVNILLGDKDKRRKMGEKSRAAVSGTYDWDAIIPKLEAVFTTQ